MPENKLTISSDPHRNQPPTALTLVLIAAQTQYKLEQISWVSFKRPENNQSHCIDPGHMSNDILQMRKWNSETISFSPTRLLKVKEESKWLVGKQIDVF